MSYILDALRRAEAERARGAVPGLHAQPVAVAPADAAPSRWPWVAAALGVAGLLFGAWTWWRLPPPPLAQAAPAVASSPAPAPVAPPPVAPPPVAPPPPPAPAAALPSPPPPLPVVTPRPPPAARPAVAPRPPPAAASAAEPAASAPTRIPRLSELPEPLRSALPPIAIGGAIGSPNPTARLLIVNGQLLHEGDEAAPGLLIREIRLRSAVLEFRGQRFEQPF